MSGLTLDAGALVAVNRGDRTMLALVEAARQAGKTMTIPAGVVAQVWRDGRKQARLASLLASRSVEIEALDERLARAAGQLRGLSKTSDVIDASVVLCAKARGQPVVTSDAGDLLKLAPRLTVIRV